MSGASNQPAPMLSADLVPCIADAEVRTAVVRVENLHLRPDPILGGESGSVRLRVLEVLYGDGLAAGAEITVPMQRMAEPLDRARNGFNHWNQLSLEPGTPILLAGQPEAAGQWRALAGMAVSSPGGSEVAAVRECYRIEHFEGPAEERQRLLERGLRSDEESLRRYIGEALTERAMLPRETSVALISAALKDSRTPAEVRRELGGYLRGTSLLIPGSGTDVVNQQIVTALAWGLVHEPSLELGQQWARLLSATLMGQFTGDRAEDARIRATLVRGVTEPRVAAVVTTLTQVASRGQESDREVARGLLELWRRTFASTPTGTAQRS